MRTRARTYPAIFVTGILQYGRQCRNNLVYGLVSYEELCQMHY